jgi:hypothetical protein
MEIILAKRKVIENYRVLLRRGNATLNSVLQSVASLNFAQIALCRSTQR